jgi:hypothetical protein
MRRRQVPPRETLAVISTKGLPKFTKSLSEHEIREMAKFFEKSSVLLSTFTHRESLYYLVNGQ